MGRLYKPRRKLRNGQIWSSEKWYLEYRDATGRQLRRPGTRSRRESLALLREVEQGVLRVKLGLGTHEVQEASASLSELVEGYLRHVAIRVRASTLREYSDSLRDLLVGGVSGRLQPWIVAAEVSDLCPAKILAYQEAASKELSARSVNRKLKALMQCLNWAKRNQLIARNPVEDLKLLPERTLNRSRSLTGEEVERLLQASPPGVREVWEVFLLTGMRKGEVASLQWGDIDFQSGKLVVRSEVSKNHKERRIPMVDRVREIFTSLFHDQDRSQIIFRRIGNRSNFYEGCYWELMRICSQLGIEGVDVHSFRRTFAVRSLQQGVSPAEVQKLMGHATANMTLEVYSQT